MYLNRVLAAWEIYSKSKHTLLQVPTCLQWPHQYCSVRSQQERHAGHAFRHRAAGSHQPQGHHWGACSAVAMGDKPGRQGNFSSLKKRRKKGRKRSLNLVLGWKEKMRRGSLSPDPWLPHGPHLPLSLPLPGDRASDRRGQAAPLSILTLGTQENIFSVYKIENTFKF